MADNEHPERRDLEPRSAPPPAPADPEQLKQFEQYQQFQQFLKFQEAQGQGGALVPTPPPGAPKTPLWKKILFSKGFRKLVLVAIVIIGLIWAYNHYFGPPPDNGLVTGGAGPGQKVDPGKEPGNPNEILNTLYQNVGLGYGNESCYLFNEQGKAAFAASYQAPTCEAAVAKLQGKAATLSAIPRISFTGKTQIAVSSCDLAVRPGTESLGRFALVRFGQGWIISGHEPEPSPCPSDTSTSGPPTSN